YNNRNPVEPPGIVVPNTTEDVKFIVNCAKLFNISLVAKGGGHSYEKFSFGRGNQLIVDFRNLNKVRVDEKRKTAIVGSGGLLGNVFHKLDSKGGFAIPGGSCPTVGIGGHTLGGGYGLSSRKHGLLIDNLIEIGIVTADGEHIIANEKQHPDLFWALRGGSLISFGLVTYFKFNLFNPPKKLAVLEYIYEPKYMHSAFDGFQNWAANDPNPSVTAVIAANKNQFEFRAVVQADDKHTNETILNEIKQYFPQANVRKKFQLMSFLEMAVYFANLPISPKDLATIKRTDHPQLYFHSKSGYIDRTLNSSEISKFIKLLQESPSSYKLLLDLQGGAINNLGRQETSFVHRRKSLYSLQIVNENDTQENGDKVEYYADEWYNQLKGVLSDEAYQNYVDGRNFNFKKYYGENLEKLLSIKRKYDPENFFKLEMSTLKPKDKSK
ncbi:FAD-binding domain-containing protein, partial [Conidiobolus coronatus NRRL 28638]